MSRRADIDLRCWDGEHSFRLRIGELVTLQEKCDAGPYEIARRLGDGTWRVHDVRETLRLGLIGAGVAQEAARRLVEEHVDRVPLLDNVANAQAVLLAAVMGVEDEVLTRDPPAPQASSGRAASSPGEASTETAPSSG